jgi:hypothetical protein
MHVIDMHVFDSYITVYICCSCMYILQLNACMHLYIHYDVRVHANVKRTMHIRNIVYRRVLRRVEAKLFTPESWAKEVGLLDVR